MSRTIIEQSNPFDQTVTKKDLAQIELRFISGIGVLKDNIETINKKLNFIENKIDHMDERVDEKMTENRIEYVDETNRYVASIFETFREEMALNREYMIGIHQRLDRNGFIK